MNPREQVDAVMQASAASGRHYRNSIPMIASENILSPLVAKAIQGDLHGRYAEGLPENGTIKSTISTQSKALELNPQKEYSIVNLPTSNRHWNGI